MVRIWLNHWFSTAYDIIQMIRRENPDFYFIGSNENERSVIATVCDEWYREPVRKDDEYVEFCLDFCKEHSVDVFLPRREAVSISRRKHDFEQIGVKVMVDEYEIVSVLNQKDQAYRMLAQKGITTIPDYEIVTTVKEFQNAYELLKAKYREV